MCLIMILLLSELFKKALNHDNSNSYMAFIFFKVSYRISLVLDEKLSSMGDESLLSIYLYAKTIVYFSF